MSHPDGSEAQLSAALLYGRVNISRLNRKWETGNGGNMEREENIRDNIIKLLQPIKGTAYRSLYSRFAGPNPCGSISSSVKIL